jgi:hypothetical protein
MFYWEDNQMIQDQIKSKLTVTMGTHVLIVYLYLGAYMKLDQPIYMGGAFLNLVRLIACLLLHF